MKVSNAEYGHRVTSPASGNRLPIASPEGIPGEEFLEDVRKILASKQLTNGPRVRQFEEVAAAYLGVPDCVAVSSCTTGLLLVFRVLGLRGEVILPSFTFHATAHGLLWNGLKPVFADCDERTFCIDPDAVREMLSSRTAAIVAVHMFGCPAAVATLADISATYQVPLIYDAAHAFGSKTSARHVGTFGVAEVFSFSPTKLLVAGEGGLIATQDGALAERLRAARNYGDAGDGNPSLLGLNARMSEFHAALALSGFATLEARINRRNELRLQYLRRLGALPGLSFQHISTDVRSTCKDMTILVDEVGFGASRDWLQNVLREQRIETRRYFWPPVHRQHLYTDVWDGRPLPVTEHISNRVLNLPIYSSLTDEAVNRICDAVLRAFEMVQHAYYSARTPQRHRPTSPSATITPTMPRPASGREV
jgi:dTDP-4-amino-4,6-dideoxygalactose transaminase